MQRDKQEAQVRDSSVERVHRQSSVGEFATGVVHDLQALLLPIAQQALSLRTEAGLNRASQGRLQQILDSVELARELVEQILSFSLGSTGEPRALSLGSVVRESVPLLRAAIGDRAQLRIALDSGAPDVLADPISMRRVLLNLVLNAAREVSPPHGVIEIGVAGMISPDHDEQFVRLTVADNSRGMDGASRDALCRQLSEPVLPADDAPLGLRIAKQTIVKFGGTVHLDSAPGNGTTIRIDLPVASARAIGSVSRPRSDDDPSNIRRASR